MVEVTIYNRYEKVIQQTHEIGPNMFAWILFRERPWHGSFQFGGCEHVILSTSKWGVRCRARWNLFSAHGWKAFLKEKLVFKYT